MSRRSLALIGAGNIRCCPSVLASIAALDVLEGLDIRLYDANQERLDLYFQLAGTIMDLSDREHDVFRRPVLKEALDKADVVILPLNEDCSRRMTGKSAAMGYLPSEIEEDETPSWPIQYGDINRPTPADELSVGTLSQLSSPVGDSRGRNEAVTDALTLVERGLFHRSSVLNLTRAAGKSGIRGKHLEWPPPMEDREIEEAPHQVLRWVEGDYSLRAFVQDHRTSPVAEWLTREFRTQ